MQADFDELCLGGGRQEEQGDDERAHDWTTRGFGSTPNREPGC